VLGSWAPRGDGVVVRLRLFSRAVFAVVCRLGRLLERGTEVLHERHVRATEGLELCQQLELVPETAGFPLPKGFKGK